ncbi:MAG: MBL fold metallo-hydrolase [Spirochaetaceae bacterium]|nr:MAG: MBL fold metallo-hydrolase [Spirochaetaceae bacterium]
MKTLHFVMTAFLAISFSSPLETAAQEAPTASGQAVTVTYLGCAGFLLETGSQKVLIDGVFTANGVRGFITPAADTLEKIRTAAAPFDKIDLFLVGHAHEDHFDAAITDACMTVNKTAKLICPQEVASKLTELSGNHYASYKDRIVIPTLTDLQSLDTKVNNIDIQITKFPAFSYHANGVIVFNIKLAGMNIFHLMGTLLPVEVYSSKAFQDRRADLLLVTAKYLEGSTSIFENNLPFKMAFVHHIYRYTTAMDSYLTKCKQLTENGRKTYVLQAVMEKHTFIKTGDQLLMDTTK